MTSHIPDAFLGLPHQNPFYDIKNALDYILPLEMSIQVKKVKKAYAQLLHRYDPADQSTKKMIDSTDYGSFMRRFKEERESSWEGGFLQIWQDFSVLFLTEHLQKSASEKADHAAQYFEGLSELSKGYLVYIKKHKELSEIQRAFELFVEAHKGDEEDVEIVREAHENLQQEYRKQGEEQIEFSQKFYALATGKIPSKKETVVDKLAKMVSPRGPKKKNEWIALSEEYLKYIEKRSQINRIGICIQKVVESNANKKAEIQIIRDAHAELTIRRWAKESYEDKFFRSFFRWSCLFSEEMEKTLLTPRSQRGYTELFNSPRFRKSTALPSPRKGEEGYFKMVYLLSVEYLQFLGLSPEMPFPGTNEKCQSEPIPY